MNNVQLIGRLTRDPDLKYSIGQNQTAICRFSLAVNSGYGDKKKADYPSIVIFGKLAENCDKYLRKGSLAAVTGRLQTGNYTNKDGIKVYTTEVIASSVEFLQSKGSSQKSQEEAPAQSEEGMPSGFSSLADDDIPF